MVVVDIKGNKFYLDGYLKSNLDIAKDAVKEDWDMVFLIDGMEGSGKSVLGIQICKYLDENFDVDNIAFTPNDFIEKVKAAKQYSAVLYDEAYAGLSSRATLSATNKVLVSMLSEIRQKNLFVVIIQPCFFELDRYVSLWRGRALLHVYTKEKLKRGQYAFFNYEKKKLLWILGKRHFTYNKPTSDFVGTFINQYPIDEKEYRKRKGKALMHKDKIRKETRDEIWKNHVIKIIKVMHEDLKFSFQKISDYFGMTKTWSVELYKQNIDENTKKSRDLFGKPNNYFSSDLQEEDSSNDSKL